MKSKKASKDVDRASELEASIVASFSTVLPSILVGNKKETLGGAYECLISCAKSYDVWHPVGPQGSSGLRVRIRDGSKLVTARLKSLRDTLTSNGDVRELATLLASDSLSFVNELIEFVETQYRELTDLSSFSSTDSWSLIIDCLSHIFVELHQARSTVLDSGAHRAGLYLWGFIKAWIIQERYRRNEFKDDPSLTGLLVRRLMVHNGEETLRKQLDGIASNAQQLDKLTDKVSAHHSKHTALQRRVKALESK
jgi:uncharacterized protein YneF (UPF0154 family)